MLETQSHGNDERMFFNVKVVKSGKSFILKLTNIYKIEAHRLI